MPDKVRGLDLVYRAEGSRWKVLNRRGTRSLLFKGTRSLLFKERSFRLLCGASLKGEDQLGVAVVIFRQDMEIT